MPSIEEVMPWLHLVFDAWKDYREQRAQEAQMLAGADEDTDKKKRKKKKKKKRDKND